jgi:hypothetical protein
MHKPLLGALVSGPGELPGILKIANLFFRISLFQLDKPLWLSVNVRQYKSITSRNALGVWSFPLENLAVVQEG